MRISDWSSDVCSSDLVDIDQLEAFRQPAQPEQEEDSRYDLDEKLRQGEVGCGEPGEGNADGEPGAAHENEGRKAMVLRLVGRAERTGGADRSEEHTSELQSLMRSSYAVFCLKKKNKHHYTITH